MRNFWHDPSATLECLIHRPAFEALPKDLQAIVRHAAKAANGHIMADFTAHHNDALKVLVGKYQVELRPFPWGMLHALRQHADAVVREMAETDSFSRRVYDSYRTFYSKVRNWTAISEKAYLDTRAE